jgi:hypothetical protein
MADFCGFSGASCGQKWRVLATHPAQFSHSRLDPKWLALRHARPRRETAPERMANEAAR